jgi:hypothetical protein
VKAIKYFPLVGMLIICFGAFSGDSVQLTSLYKTGKIRLEQEFVLGDDALPGDVFFDNPSTVTCDREGNIYVVDSGATNIKKFDGLGKFLKVFGREGQGPGEFGRLYFSAFAGDHLVLWDSGNRRLCAFAPDGEFIDSTNIPYDAGSVRKLRGLPTGDVLVEMEKTFRSEPDKPQECRIDLYSKDLQFVRNIYERNLRRMKYIRTKEYGTSVLYFPYSADVQWEVTPDGHIAIGYSEDYDIEIFDSSGKKVLTFTHTHEPVNVTEKDKKDFFDSISFYRMGERLKDPPEYITKYTEFPPHKPVYKNILADEEGNIWVLLNREKGDEDGKTFDVFDPAGKFIARVQVDGDATFPDNRNAYILHKRSLLLIVTGADDLYRIIRYKVSG